MPTAHDKALLGNDYQNQAKQAYENGEFEEAYYLYVEAETLYREAINGREFWVDTRLFFTQSSALRCLELILDDKYFLSDVYLSKVRKFLDDWTEEKIISRISDKHRTEAFVFRSWRESYLKGLKQFSLASQALNQGDLVNAKRILDEFIAKMESSQNADAKELRVLARSKIEMLPVHVELRKHEQQRNILVIASGFLRAARVSYLPKKEDNSNFSERQLCAAYRAQYCSDALKWRAFSVLRNKNLVKAEHYFTKAVAYAKKAASLGDFPRHHAVYLSYWRETVTERLYLLTYMANGSDADFNWAQRAWQRALGAAESMCKNVGEESFFPNRFYSMQDLRLEQYFLDAAKAFKESRWTKCINQLEYWRAECPQEFLWSWRSVNVYIRLLGTKIINAIERGDNDQLPRLCNDLKNISSSEPIGSATRFFVDNVVMLPVRRRNRSQFSSVLASLAEFFPLDSYVDCYQQPDRIDQFVSLPKKIHDSLVISPPPSTETEVERLKVKIIGGIEAFLGYMCDYYAQAATPVDTVPDYGIHNLVGRCHKFPFGWAQRPMFQNQIELLQSATDKMARAKSPEEFNIAYDEIRGALLGLKRFAPVVVNISSTTLRTEEPIALESFPDWAFELVARRVIFIFVRPDVLPSINPGNYYLRPAWRRGNRCETGVE